MIARRVELLGGLLKLVVEEEDGAFRWYVVEGKPIAGALTYKAPEEAERVGRLIFRERCARDPAAGPETHSPEMAALLEDLEAAGYTAAGDEDGHLLARRAMADLQDRLAAVQGELEARRYYTGR